MPVRQYKSSDLANVLDTWETASQVGHPFLSKSFLKSERDNIPLVYLPNGDVWVFTVQSAVVGFMILHGNEVGALFVKPDYHGKGVGFALMNKASELHEKLNVEVFEKNSVGANFYFRYGFAFSSEYQHEETGMMMLCLEKHH